MSADNFARGVTASPTPTATGRYTETDRQSKIATPQINQMNTRNIQVDRKTDGTHQKKSYENQAKDSETKKETKHDPRGAVGGVA